MDKIGNTYNNLDKPAAKKWWRDGWWVFRSTLEDMDSYDLFKGTANSSHFWK